MTDQDKALRLSFWTGIVWGVAGSLYVSILLDVLT